MATPNSFKLLTATGRSTTVPRECIVAFQWQNTTVLNCLHLQAGQQQYNGNALLRFNGKDGYENAPQYCVIWYVGCLSYVLLRFITVIICALLDIIA